jgi:VIT1/CCC1 family predicted Fe2+/Mn2+ transporter
MTDTTAASSSGLDRLRRSLYASLGDIVFGMEDGTVSIFGLVFGIAATADSSRVVLLAGATGAVAAAISMMAGTYLDVESERDKDRVLTGKIHREVETDPASAANQVSVHLTKVGVKESQVQELLRVADNDPATLAGLMLAFHTETHIEDLNPVTRSLWMLGADLIAAFVPVLPFFFLPLGAARIASVGITSVLLILLGIGRARIGKRNIFTTTLETLFVAALAALAGLLIGQFINNSFGK